VGSSPADLSFGPDLFRSGKFTGASFEADPAASLALGRKRINGEFLSHAYIAIDGAADV
jgi:hypothetical protein